MPIHTNPLPQSAVDALEHGVAAVRSPVAPRTSVRLTSGHAAHWSDGLPQEMFTLGLDDVTHDRGLAAARSTGWFVLLGEPLEPPSVAAEVHAVPSGHEFSAIHFGPFAAQTLDAFRGAEADPAVRAADYEPRRLRIPALYVEALWLKPRASGNDILVPLPPAPSVFTLGRHYTVADFWKELVGLAHVMGAAPAKPSPTTPHAP